MFLLQTEPIDVAACRRQLQRDEAGACVIFEGWVRDHHRGRGVQRLEFEAFDEMVRLEGERMVDEVAARFPGVRVLCVHRTGVLAIGEMAVWIGATSAHRPAAFAACQSKSSGSRMAACLMLSERPAMYSRSGSVARKSVSTTTSCGW